MIEQATQRCTIDAPPERCFEVVVDFERYPEWARDVKEAVVLKRDEAGRGTQVAFRAGAMGRSARYTLEYDYAKAPNELSWTLVEGDIVSRLDGTYAFVSLPVGIGSDGAGPIDTGRTEVVYHLLVELLVPIPSFVKRRAEFKIVGFALEELKKRVEA